MIHPSIALRVTRSLDPQVPVGTHYTVPLEGGVLGRQPNAAVCIPSSTVSRTHARLVSSEAGWTVEPLTGTNGTFVGQQPVPMGSNAAVAVGDELQLGGIVLEIVRTPSDAIPATRPVLQVVQGAPPLDPRDLGHAVFHFRVSIDEETVGWEVHRGDQVIELGERAHVYLLLTLARLRLAEQHLPPADRGWTYGDELAERLGMTTETLKVQVYRARRQLRGVIDPPDAVIERRAVTQQIRFGTDRIVVH